MARKVYVDVVVQNNKDGSKRPLSFTWEDGHEYEVDRLKQICKAASLKAGGCGIRYTVMVCGKETYLFDEDGCWFIEAKR